MKQSGMVLRYISAAKGQRFGPVVITHNPHLAGDHFVLLNRRRQKPAPTYDEIGPVGPKQQIAGCDELETLRHELGRGE